MEVKKLLQYCLTKNKSYEDYPFGEMPICIKVNKEIPSI